MADLKAFEDGLVKLIGKPTPMRPFVCDGSPLDCKVFIVGFNPTTSSDFWEFWQPDGFNKSVWLETYKRTRLLEPFEPGKTRRSTISSTRRAIELIVEAASPVKILETNIYPTPSKRAKDLKKQQLCTGTFDFLLKTVKPVLIITHGKDAARHLERFESAAKVINETHLSRGWSDERARQLGLDIAQYCGGGS